MESIEQNLEIECPLCGQTHSYNLSIHRIKVLSMYEKAKKKKTFTRLFTCPNEKQDFETKFSIIEDADWEIIKFELGKLYGE
jgi:hypothetical protein